MIIQQTPFNSIEAIIFDIDFTLAIPHNARFYDDIGNFVKKQIMLTFSISDLEFEKLNNYYTSNNNWVEKSFVDFENLRSIFHLLGLNYSNIDWEMYSTGYDICREFIDLKDPTNFFFVDEEIVCMLENYKKSKIKISALSNCPENLSRRVLRKCGINPDYFFDIYYPWLNHMASPPKVTFESKVFLEIAERLAIDPCKIISIGDNFHMDIVHAKNAGMKTCHISEKFIDSTIHYKSVLDFFVDHQKNCPILFGS
jgi:FMN phosphatase YigB (HAD superfamily)